MKRLTLIILALIAALVLAGMRPAAATAQDNAAVAVNTKDGTSIFKLAFKVHRVTGEVVDNSNAAVAVASCEECQAIAVAFQVVLVFSDPALVEPVNVAIALNLECTSCLAFASAYQWVLGTGGPVHFTAQGNKRLADLRKRLNELRKRDLTLEELIAELEAIRAEIADILDTELVPAKPKDKDEDDGELDEDGESGTQPTTTTEPTTMTEPTPTEEVTTTTSE